MNHLEGSPIKLHAREYHDPFKGCLDSLFRAVPTTSKGGAFDHGTHQHAAVAHRSSVPYLYARSAHKGQMELYEPLLLSLSYCRVLVAIYQSTVRMPQVFAKL